MEPGRQCQNQAQFHQFRRLDLLTAQFQPTLGAFADVANLQNQQQQYDATGVGDPGKSGDDSECPPMRCMTISNRPNANRTMWRVA